MDIGRGLGDVDRQKRRPVGMGTGVFDLVIAVGLADLGQLPAAIEPWKPVIVFERDISGAVHACRPSVGGKALLALKGKKPPVEPDQDIGSGEFHEGVAQLAQGALVALAGGRLGQAKFSASFDL